MTKPRPNRTTTGGHCWRNWTHDDADENQCNKQKQFLQLGYIHTATNSNVKLAFLHLGLGLVLVVGNVTSNVNMIKPGFFWVPFFRGNRSQSAILKIGYRQLYVSFICVNSVLNGRKYEPKNT